MKTKNCRVFANFLALVILSILVPGCTTKEIRYVERQQPSEQYKTKSSSCKPTYEIYEKCYGLGIGETTEDCANLTTKIYQKINLGDRKTEATISLFCGVACAQAAKQEGMDSYDVFSRKFCN